MKISDELREFIDERDLYPTYIAELRRIAKRIDAEMIELPKDADGVPIHVGDTVYGCRSGMEMTISELRMTANGWSILTSSGYLTDAAVTHTRHDSWERIAQELEDTSEHFRATDEETFSALLDFADRIRRLADKEEQR